MHGLQGRSSIIHHWMTVACVSSAALFHLMAACALSSCTDPSGRKVQVQNCGREGLAVPNKALCVYHLLAQPLESASRPLLATAMRCGS